MGAGSTFLVVLPSVNCPCVLTVEPGPGQHRANVLSNELRTGMAAGGA